MSEAPSAGSLRSVGTAPGSVDLAAEAGGVEGWGCWEERGRRVEVVACRKEVQRLQQLMLKASVAPRVVSLTSEGRGQRACPPTIRQFAEVSSCVRWARAQAACGAVLGAVRASEPALSEGHRS